MTNPESASWRRKPARKANGSGTIKKRKDGRYEGQVFRSHDKRGVEAGQRLRP